MLLSIRGSEGTNTYSRRLLQAAITSLIFGEEDDPLDEVAILSTTDDLERAIRVELETFGGGVSKRVAIQAKIGMKHGVWCPAGPQMSQPSPDDPFADLDIACPRIQLHQDGQLLVLNVFGYSIRPKAVRYRLSEYSFIHTSDGFSRLSESRKSTWHSREELEQWLENRASRR